MHNNGYKKINTTMIFCSVVSFIAIYTCLLPIEQVHVQVYATTISNAAEPLPVILIHGYLSDSSVWKKWEDL